MSGSEEKKLNSLHEEDSLYKAQGRLSENSDNLI
jgi:hypothetical protein